MSALAAGTAITSLLSVMLLGQAACWLMARGLHMRLDWRAVAGGWLATLILLAPWLPGDRLLAPTAVLALVPGASVAEQAGRAHNLLSDSVLQMLPWEIEVRRSLSSGHWPFWSDLLDGGSSPWANPQAAVLSPMHLAARLLPIERHPLVILALAVLIAFQGVSVLARVAGCSRPAALLAATAFALGGGVSSYAIFPVVTTLPWTPWLAAATVRLMRRPGRRTVAVAALLTGVILTSGHPETAVFGGLFAAACGLGLGRPGRLLRDAGLAAGAAVLGFALAAPAILPFIDLTSDSARALDSLGVTRPDDVHPLTPGVFVSGFTAFVLGPAGPHVYGRPYRDSFRGPFNWVEATATYSGLAVFAATLAAMTLRTPRSRPFLVFAVISLWMASRIFPFASWLDAVPMLRLPAYGRLLPVMSLACCIAAAFAIEAIADRRRERRVWTAIAAAALISLSIHADWWTVACWGGILAALVAVRYRPSVGLLALGLVMVVDLVPWSRSLLPRGEPAMFYPRTPLVSFLEHEVSGSDARVTGGDYLVYPHVLAPYGLADFRFNNPLAPERYRRVLATVFDFDQNALQYYAPLRNLDHPMLDFLGVRAVVGSPAVPSVTTLQRVDGERFLPFTVLRNPDALPRWFVPAGIEHVETMKMPVWLDGMRRADIVAIEDDISELTSAPPGALHPATVVSSSRPGDSVIAVPGDGDRLLASSVPWVRGWSARAESTQLRTVIVNGAFLGVHVPPGVSTIELRYLPPYLRAGVAAALIAALVCGYCLLSRSPDTGVSR